MVLKLNEVKNKKNKWLIGFITVWTLPFFIFWHNIKAASFNCFSSSDLGIYAQALYEIAAKFPQQLNPFVTVRGINIFNDHFDPIILLVAPLTRLFKYRIEGVLFIEILWALATMGLLAWKSSGKSKNVKHALYFLFLFVFCKGVLVALAFPIHPTTWAMFPCLLLVYAFVNDDFWSILGSAFLVCLFKEDFPFAVLGLSGAYLLRRDFKKFLSLFFLSVIFILFDFVWRPLLLGPTYAHGNGLLATFINSPLSALGEALKVLNWGNISMFYPFAIPVFYLIYREIFKDCQQQIGKKIISHPIFPTFFFLAPLFVIRLLAQAFHFHYTAPLVVMILGLLSTSTSVKESLDKRPRWAVFVLLLFIMSSSSVYTKMVKLVFMNRPPKGKCLIGEEKGRSTVKLMTSLSRALAHNVEGTEIQLMSTGGIIPQILRPGRLISHLGGLSLKRTHYELMLLEMGGSGDTWPYSWEQIAKMGEKCRSYAQEIIYEDTFYLLMKGKFPRTCLDI